MIEFLATLWIATTAALKMVAVTAITLIALSRFKFFQDFFLVINF